MVFKKKKRKKRNEQHSHAIILSLWVSDEAGVTIIECL